MKLVTIKEAASTFEMHPATVRQRIKDGEWPVYEFGRKSRRLDLDEIRRLSRTDRQGTRPAAA